jgi:hypothetical protein
MAAGAVATARGNDVADQLDRAGLVTVLADLVIGRSPGQ